MTRHEAEAILVRIASLEITLSRTTHARARAGTRGFTLFDVIAVLNTHVIQQAPRWNEKHSSDRVSLRGRCLKGRPTRVILDLRPDGHCRLVTLMVAHDSSRRR